MPQMSPLWWFVLFLYFTLLFIFYIVNLYYSVWQSGSSLTSPQILRESSIMIWKW